MCTIFAYENKSCEISRIEQALSETVGRGPDDQRIELTPAGWMAFQRLAIMGLHPSGMQPFWLNGNALICNGEIYGFKKDKAWLEELGYSFQSQSDCEILLPLYEQFGLGMFSRLDAEFALVLYDHDQNCFIAARDPIGIRPLFYGFDAQGNIAFASEARNLQGLVEKILPFPPGHYYDGKEFVCYEQISQSPAHDDHDLDVITKNIREKLIAGVEKRLDADAPVAFLLSGGLDSSLVCSIAASLSEKPIETYAIGMAQDAIDLKYARQVADYLNSNHHEIVITPQDLFESLDELIRILATWDVTTIRASLGMYLLCKAIHEQSDHRVLLTGEISDELFGYKYTDFAPDASSFQQEAEKRIDEIHMYDVLRADRCIASNSLEARVPFGDLDFVRYVMGIDPALKMNTYGCGKYLLRKAFEGDYLPEEILYRQKAAFSDAVGHSLADELKAFAQKHYSDQEFEEKREEYEHAKPYSKESLLYREIFEKHYPDQSGMIVDFWMPNASWPGCQVNDPSARYLSNYDQSGQ